MKTRFALGHDISARLCIHMSYRRVSPSHSFCVSVERVAPSGQLPEEKRVKWTPQIHSFTVRILEE
jgi:hypothetical protein